MMRGMASSAAHACGACHVAELAFAEIPSRLLGASYRQVDPPVAVEIADCVSSTNSPVTLAAGFFGFSLRLQFRLAALGFVLLSSQRVPCKERRHQQCQQEQRLEAQLEPAAEALGGHGDFSVMPLPRTSRSVNGGNPFACERT